ncbi:MAG: T9SS type A sorting domain-containing protein [Chitinophagaceae bacterium]
MKKSMLLTALLAFYFLQAFSQTQDFTNIQKLLAGGFTTNPDNPFDSSAPSYMALFPQVPYRLGTCRVRLLNVDNRGLESNTNGTVKRNPDHSLAIKWTNNFENSLWMCKRYNWIPRIVWGLNPPTPLVTLRGKPGNRLYGPNNWNVFNEYTTDMLKHVIEDWGFKKIEVEVGNEPTGYQHAIYEWWMADISNPPPSDTLMWEASLAPYCKLYKNIASSVKNYGDQHPEITISVGGPASNFGTFMPKAFPWIQTFVSKMLKDSVPLDFVSFHCYDKAHYQGQTFLNAVAALKTTLANAGSKAKISVSEWGFSTGIPEDSTNLEPVAGAFALDFMYTAEKANIDNDIFLGIATNELNNASLFYPHTPSVDNPKFWNPSHAMMALRNLSDLSKGTRYMCNADSLADIHCFAAETAPGKIQILVWAYNWQTAVSHFNWLPDTISNIRNVVLKIYGLTDFDSSKSIRKSISINGDPDSLSAINVSISADSILSISGLNLKKGDYAKISLNVQQNTNVVQTSQSISSTNELTKVKAQQIENKTPLFTLPYISHQTSDYSFYSQFFYSNTSKNMSDELNTSQLKLYPDPVKNVLNIQGLNASVNTTLCIVNVYGQIIKQLITERSSYYSCNVYSLSSGTYFLKIITSKKISMLKFIKE